MIIGILLILFLILFVIPEAAYQTYAFDRSIQSKLETKRAYSDSINRISWVANDGYDEYEVAPLMPWHTPICLFNVHRNNQCTNEAVLKAAKLLALKQQKQQKSRNLIFQVEYWFHYIWLSRNASVPQVIKINLDLTYFGSGQIGIEKASQFYLNKPVSEITVPEIIALLSISPPSMRTCKSIRESKAKLTRSLESKGVITRKTSEEIVKTPLPKKIVESCEKK